MKKIDLNKIAKRFFLGNILAAAIFLSMQASAANTRIVGFNEGEKSIDSSKTNKLEVKYLGSQNDNLIFDVHYNNLKGTSFAFVVKDEDGDVLFEKEYNNKQFHKKVELARIDDLKKLSFSIVSYGDNLVQTKDIMIKTRFVEDVLVKIN